MRIYDYDKDNKWELKLLGAIIKRQLEDYIDVNSVYRKRAHDFFFAHMHETADDGLPVNDLERWLSYTDMDADYIRKNIRRD